jgi:hypothetical protein
LDPCPDFLLEPDQPAGIVGKDRRQDFQCNFAAETGIPRAIHLTHAAAAERRDDDVRPKRLARLQVRGL